MDELYSLLLNRMNITWEPDDAEKANILAALEEACAYLQSVAGTEVDFSKGENQSLLLICAWYFVENKRADFTAEYCGELNTLRLMEGFACGQENDEI